MSPAASSSEESLASLRVRNRYSSASSATEVAIRLGASGTEDPGPMASAAELALEYLFLTRKLAKDSSEDDAAGDTVTYG